jgi:uncharacterized protein (TIGR00369 family)
MSIWKEIAEQQDPNDVPMCFACGRDNAIGLKLEVRRDGDAVRTEFTPGEQYQGWPGVVHGGIICTMLDEVLGYAAGFQGLYAVTARMDVQYRKPAMVGKRLLLSAKVTSVSGRDVRSEGQIRDEDGTLVAEAQAELRIIKTE